MDAATPDIDAIQQAIGHVFGDPQLLREALTHSSAVNKRRGRRAGRAASNERLEFLGDRVLGLIIANAVMARHPDEAEGELTDRLVALVRRETLADVALAVGLDQWLVLARGEEDGGGRQNPGILADCCEALIGAIYLDGGLEAARRFVDGQWRDRVEAMRKPPRDPKMALQEWAHAHGMEPPTYRTLDQKGPPHAPTFTILVTLGDKGSEEAAAGSKRAGEQAAALRLLDRLPP